MIIENLLLPLLTNIGFITNIRGSQLIIIVLVILLLFGSKRLPDLARGFGKAIREFRQSASQAEKDFRSAMEDPKKSEVSKPSVETNVTNVAGKDN